MNIAHIAPDSNVSWREIEPGKWLVMIGDDTRTITRQGRKFIAWIGSQTSFSFLDDRFETWAFTKALDACVKDAEFHAGQNAERAKDAAYLASLSPEYRANFRAVLESEIEGLNYSDSIDATARQDRLRAQLEVIS